MANLTGKGGFTKGQSGNPGGRPKGDTRIRELAQDLSEKAIQVLEEILNDEKAQDSVKIAAANAILDRAIGKPTQHTLNEEVDSQADILKRLEERDEQITQELKDSGCTTLKLVKKTNSAT